MRTPIRPAGGSDAGVSLVELLISMILSAVVGTMVVGAVIQASRFVTHNEDEERGLQDAKVIMDRLGRDVRQSRGVVCDGGLSDPSNPATTDANCESHLQLWVDSNSDYVQQDSEVITWRLQRATDGEHFDVWRTTGTGTPLTSKREATSLWTAFAFQYDPAPGGPDMSRVTRVNVEIQYDAIIGRGTSLRHAQFSARLRNKGA
jgi:Tfp pilus assembly protein PilW